MAFLQIAFFCALGAIRLAGGPAMAAVKVWPVPIRTLDGAPAPRGYHVLRSATEWTRAVDRPAGGAVGGRRSIPSVNWGREMVIAAGMGERPTAGYSVDVTSVKRVGREIVVTVRETSPTPDMMVAQVITYPSDVVAVKRMTGPVVFVVNGVRRAPGDVRAAPAAQKPDARPDAGLATSLFVVRESGGIAGMDRQTYVHLYGRPIKPQENWPGARQDREAKINGPLLRLIERTVRDSGFMALNERYAADRPIADGMARTIRVHMDGKVKTVTVEDGADIPQSFEDVWAAIQTALNSKGTTIAPRP